METADRLGALEIRLATRDDVPAIAELIPLSVRGLGAGHYGAEQIEASLLHVFGPDTRLVDDGTYFVVVAGAGAGGELAGAGGWGRRRTLFGGDQTKGGEDSLLDPAREPARLRAFYVHPEWARRGVATRIAEECFRAMRAAGFREVELMATLPGVPLYERLGFVARERHDVPMPGGLVLPCVRMRRAVP